MSESNSATLPVDGLAPIAPVVTLVEVTDAELSKYATLIYERTGIRVSPQKKTLLSNRLRRRLRETGIPSFTAYYEHLRKLTPQDPEWEGFLQEITTHETYLFRDNGQWDWFRKVYLPHLAAEAQGGRRRQTLRIWSAACSTGDEAFTIATCIVAGLPNYKSWQVQIVGTDIGAGAVEQARLGQFAERAMRQVPADYRKKYFHRNPTGVYQASPLLMQLVSFKRHNLLDRLRDNPFDLVFLKNVLIYFTPESKRIALDHVRSAIVPGGLLVAGPTEGISDLVRDYTRLQPWLYRRPMQ
jgi:chemotaxis protein methyltransferase CheR